MIVINRIGCDWYSTQIAIILRLVGLLILILIKARVE